MKLTRSFQIHNEVGIDIILHLEPEGSTFPLAPKKAVEVYLSDLNGLDLFVEVDGDGMQHFSFWPKIGNYKLLIDGIDVWDLILDKDFS